ncbi:MAG: hypothetical protein GY798_29725 [Hyphomicrobiales bacterium]|nr:hypothetical protein [Hyphomicrobiales bacterium]
MIDDTSLDGFLAALIAQTNAQGRQYLARTMLGFGGARTFGQLELRSYTRDRRDEALAEVLDWTYSTRALFLNDRQQRYGSADVLGHMPQLYRVPVRPSEHGFNDAVTLQLWHPGHVAEHANSVALLPKTTVHDVLATPVTQTAELAADDPNVAIPPLRIAGGAVDGHLMVGINASFCQHMALDLGQATLFDLFGIHLTDDGHWPVRVTAEGLEFDATLPDPTRGFAGGGTADDRIAARVRLQTVPNRQGLVCPYVLRLIGPSWELEAEGSQEALSGRLAQAAGSLVEEGNPARLRLDTLGALPPVFWPLRFVPDASTGHSSLRFVPVPGAAAEAVMQIDPAALDLRLSTRSDHPDAETGLARVHLDEAAWLRVASGFRMAFRAGHAPGVFEDRHGAGGTDYALTFSRGANGWSGSLSGQLSDIPVHLPQERISAQLTPLYRAANAILETEEAPYAFLAARDGWMQMPLGLRPDTQDPVLPEDRGAQAMTGRIVFFPSTGDVETEAVKGLSIDDARSMAVDVNWTGTETRPARIDLRPGDAAGQFLGFLYTADTSPDAQDAVPVWTAGDATTREVPLWFGGPQDKIARLTWSRDAGETWSLTFDADLTWPDKENRPWLAWLSPGPHPFVTNYPMARTSLGARIPSATRGMLPYHVTGAPVLSYTSDGGATDDGLPRLTGPGGTALTGQPYDTAAQPRPDAPLMQSLLLPTLNGTESPVPMDTSATEWVHQMRLRYDLPLLDELFAWSDPPPAEPKAGQFDPLLPETTDAEQRPIPPVVTALTPARLAEVWRANEHRMQLTWTQDAVVSPDLLPTDATVQTVRFDKIAAPFPFDTEVAITLSPDHLFGDLSFPQLPDQPSGLAGALVGLGGRLTPEDAPLPLVLKNGALRPAGQDEAASVTVTGYAADHYDDPDSKLMADNRGGAIAPLPDANRPGLRKISVRNQAGALQHGVFLLTMQEDQEVRTPQIDFDFALRDLPVQPGPGGAGFVFHGVSIAGQTGGRANPVEGRRTYDGQAFDADNMLHGLHEWRCYGLDETAPLLGRFEISTGPFSFRPLRLVRAEFADDLRPRNLHILGSLVLRAAGEDAGGAFAFGPDRVYDRDDLFVLTATRRGDDWTTTLIAHEASTPTSATIALEPSSAPSLTLSRRLTCASGSQFHYDGSMQAGIKLTFDRDAPWPVVQTAELHAHLFGGHVVLLNGRATPDGPGGLTLNFDVPTAATPGPLHLQDLQIEIKLSANGTSDTMEMTGTMRLSADPGAADSTALLELSGNARRWLDLSLPADAVPAIMIDHDEGALTLNIEPQGLDPTASPLFGLTYPAGAQPELTGSIAAVLVPGKAEIATAICHIDLHDAKDKGYLIQHCLTVASASDHAVLLTWSTPERPCPIRWPVGPNEVALNEGDRLQTLDQIAEGPLEPDPFSVSGGEQNRLLHIAPGGETLTHHVTLTLNAHRIDATRLRRTDAGIEPAETLRMMATAKHRLTSDQDAELEATWHSLDHVAVTSAIAMQEEAQRMAFAPRVSTKGGITLNYRGDPVKSVTLPAGMTPISDANLSGFHDASMLAHLWENADVTGAVFLGCGALRLPLPVPPGQQPNRAHVAQLPWAMGLPDDTALQLSKQPLTWRISTADAWAAHAVHVSTTRPARGLNTGLAEPGIRQRLDAAADRGQPLDPTQLIPAEPAFFEGWADGAPVGIGQAAHPHGEAPYFLRALLALRARWRAFAAQGGKEWSVQSLVPQPWRTGKTADHEPLLDSAATMQVIVLTDDLHAGSRPDPAAVFPADMVALSRADLTRAEGYRSIRAAAASSAGGGAPAELREIAETLDHQARAAMRLVRLQGGRMATLARILSRADDPLAGVGEVLVRPKTSVGASPALGWPIASQPLAGAMQAGFGPDRAVQAPEPGFSGRGQRIVWPAHAVDAGSPTDAVFASFGQHVVFDRGLVTFSHDGPPARHLAPSPTRRRAPEPALTNAVLTRPDTDPGDLNAPKPRSQTPEGWMPRTLTPARVDRLTIGRRPGAMEVSTASLTLAGRRANLRALLDAGWPGMGRPADGAPVLAHGMRTPRSTVLPPDPHPDDLNLRRRTYLSRADMVAGADGAPELSLFETFDDPRDVIRIALEDGTFWRIDAGSAGGAKALSIGPTWQGSLRLRLTGYYTDPDNQLRMTGNPQRVLGLNSRQDATLIAQLVIGGLVTPHRRWNIDTEDDAVVLTLTFPDVAALQSRLAAVTADTPLTLMLKFPRAADVAPAVDLDLAPGVAMELPLTLDPGARRVVRTLSRTIAFGDPAYDRVLASQAALVSDRVGDEEFRAAADRREYNPGSTMMLAFGQIDSATDLFTNSFSDNATVKFERTPLDAPETTEKLLVQPPSGAPKETVSIKAGKPVRLRLTDLRDETAHDVAPLSAGDTLIVSVGAPNGFKAVLRVRIVAAPVIAPPASVYSVIETVRPTARTRLHAPGSLPTRIEFPALADDLARGHVRREALFVWHYSTPAPVSPAQDGDRHTDLIKLDRSGGGQLPSG